MGIPKEPEPTVTEDGQAIEQLEEWERDPEVPVSSNREEVGEGHE